MNTDRENRQNPPDPALDPDLAEVVGNGFARKFQDHCAKFGELMADASRMGNVVCVGAVNPKNGRQWSVMLATNDAAVDLDRFGDEQVKGRAEANAKAGIGFYVDTESTGPIFRPPEPKAG